MASNLLRPLHPVNAIPIIKEGELHDAVITELIKGYMQVTDWVTAADTS